MNEKTFVIAGTIWQAKEWIKQDIEKKYPTNPSLTISHYVYVDSPSRLRGYNDPHGVFIGTWRSRSDIKEIVETLLQCCYRNPALEKIHQELLSQHNPSNNLFTSDEQDELNYLIEEHTSNGK
jgi:hypothetical protein